MFLNRLSIKSLRLILAAVFIFVTVSVSVPRTASAWGYEMNFFVVQYLLFLTLVIPIKLQYDPQISYGEARGKGMDGDQTVLDVSLPIPVNEKLSFGVYGGCGKTKLSWDRFSTRVEGDIVRGGGFAVITPTPDIRLLFDYTYSHLDSDFEGFGSTGTFATDVHTIHGEISKRFDRGKYWLEPIAGFVYAHADRESFVDTVFFETTPQSDIELTRFFGGLTMGVPIPAFYHCDENDAGCQPGLLYVRVRGFHDDLSGEAKDPTFPPDARLDDNYLGVSGTVGANIPVSKTVSIGGALTGFNAGDLDGYMVKAFVNITLW